MNSARSTTARSPIGVIERWADRIDVDDATPRVTLGEGSTPLTPAPRLGKHLGDTDVYLKLELANPTGSFKDRGMCVAVARAIQEGAHTLVCASTGNTSASAAAFAAAAGLRCVVVIPDGKIASGKLVQAQIAGAVVVAVEGSFDDALREVRALAHRPGWALVNSVNPYRIEGQKTASYEVAEILGDAPDWLCLPVGNAGNITAWWKGWKELYEAGEITHLPRILGIQAAGAAPLVDGAPVDNPETIATAIRIGKPARGDQALTAISESNGRIIKRTDEQLLDAYQLVAHMSGIFCEPASAISIAGLNWATDEGLIEPGDRVVCVLTGHGLKDPDTAVSLVGSNITRVQASAEAIAHAADAHGGAR